MTDQEDAKTKGEYVSTAPKTSVLSQGGSPTTGQAPAGKSARALEKEARKKAQKAHPWRDNIEAVAISIVTIVLFKYFVLEAYKIPTGSMQPTLMGNEETGIYDRVIVDKFSYHYRDPERFEIAVFKYPLDSSKNFIKRIVGMPGERLFLQGGDAWIQPKGEEPRVLRRPRAIQDAQLRRIDTHGEWEGKRRPESWTLASTDDGDTLRTKGNGRMTYPQEFESIRDGYLDGYPAGVIGKISEKNKRSKWNDVTDLRVAAEVTAAPGVSAVTFILHEGDRRFRFTLRGPEATGDTRAISATGPGFEGESTSEAVAYQLKAGDSVEVEVQNLNDLLEFRVDGELVASLEIPPAISPNEARHVMESRITVDVADDAGGGTSIEDLKIWRDIFYTETSGRNPVTEWNIPEDAYLVLGDNSQDSSDGRDWSLAQFQLMDGDGGIVRGNSREMQAINPRTGQMVSHPESNPRYVPQQVGAKQIFLRDELGELHVLDPQTTERLPDEHFSFVPRELIRGRAVVVVWPLAPQHDVYRLKWVR
ncbi:Signal peptidase I [Planctomycetes bacterium Poly30]|uniref:Signal peptidase I n=1 Tax=Saltatorellus ferox TaxID=2528018 RepID=A0A518EN07_9BACT|nr:Signal peptidase I [Planctomycetes bacterium Poly30]